MESKPEKQNKLYTAATTMSPTVYKDFYKIYYSQKLKVFNFIAVIIAAALAVAAVLMYKDGFGLLWPLIAVWAGIFLLVYPRMLYRKPYKRSRDAVQTTHFIFYEDYMTEKSKSRTSEYRYSELERVLESGGYFIIYHNSDSVSIVDKSGADNAEGISQLLKTKTNYKRIK